MSKQEAFVYAQRYVAIIQYNIRFFSVNKY